MIKIKAIILNIRDWREADRILTLYTEKQGKIEALVRGAKKIKSKLVGFCQPFCILDLFLARGRNFYHLTGGEIIRQFKEIAGSYQKIILVSRCLCFVDKLVKTEKPDSKIFLLTAKFLERIEKANLIQAEIISQAFLIKFLSFLGYRPELKKCLVCGQEVCSQKDYSAVSDSDGHIRISRPRRYVGGASAIRMPYFNPKKGGVICSLCHQSSDSAEIEISKQILNLLENLLYQELSFWLTSLEVHSADGRTASRKAGLLLTGLKPTKIRPEEVQKVSFLIEKFLEWRM